MPVQTTFTQDFTVGFPGLLTDVSGHRTKTRAAVEDIPFGVALVSAGSSDKYCKLPSANQLVLDADLVTGNTIAGNVTLTNSDGSTTSPISVPFNTSHDQSMDDLAAALTALTGITSASKGGASNRTMTIVLDDGYTVIMGGVGTTFAVTGGASQAGVTYATNETPGFLSRHQNVEKDSDGTAEYKAKSAVNASTKCEMWATIEDAFTNASSVYVRIIENGADKRGQLRTDSASGEAVLWSDAKINNSGSAGGLGKVEINLP